jgi:hypothetical protein
MKTSIFFITLLAVSCGRYEAPGTTGSSLGQSRSMSISQMNGSDRNVITAICSALAIKSLQLPQSINTVHKFSTGQTDCSGNIVSSGDVDVVIQNDSSGYVFKRKSEGLDFIFPVIETNERGIFSAVCGNISALTSPFVNANEAIYISTSGISPEDCRSLQGEVCVAIERASVQGTSATVHTREWIRVRTGGTQGKIGFITQRKRLTKSFCGEGGSLSFEAMMK